jgi:hypothetical protein
MSVIIVKKFIIIHSSEFVGIFKNLVYPINAQKMEHKKLIKINCFFRVVLSFISCLAVQVLIKYFAEKC